MADAPFCPRTGQTMIRAERPLTISYKGRSRTIAMPGWYCDDSGEAIHTRGDMRLSSRALVTMKAEVENLATPDDVRRIRTRLGLSQAEAGRILGGGPRAFQKYESGEVLTSRAMTNLLRSLTRHPEEVETMREDALHSRDEREIA